MNLTESRRAIRGLLGTQEPADASAIYYAYHHPDQKVQITTIPEIGAKSFGYVCSARTGIDLFRPLVTMRLPQKRSLAELDYSLAADLLHKGIGDLPDPTPPAGVQIDEKPRAEPPEQYQYHIKGADAVRCTHGEIDRFPTHVKSQVLIGV